LQDAAPPLPAAVAEAVLRSALTERVDDCLDTFDPEPIAAASIGEMHRATTRTGAQVAVKLRRPGIATCVDDDLALLTLAFEALRGSLPDLDWATIEAQVRIYVRAVLDYVREAELTARVHRFFQPLNCGVIVPEPHATLCARDILTTQFI